MTARLQRCLVCGPVRINCRCYDVEREGCTRYTCVAVSPPRAGRLRVLVLIFTRYVALYVPALLWVPARSRLGELFGNKGGRLNRAAPVPFGAFLWV